MTVPTMVDYWQEETNNPFGFLDDVDAYSDLGGCIDDQDENESVSGGLLSTEDRRKLERIEALKRACGHQGFKQDPKNGNVERSTFFCGLYREGCPICLAKRAKELRERVADACQKGEMGYLYLSNDMSPSVLNGNGISANNYLRVPMENETCLVFFNRDLKDKDGEITGRTEIGETLTPDVIASINWTDLVQIPEGTRLSGRLGSRPSTPREKIEGDVSVTVATYITRKLKLTEQRIAIDLAIAETSHIDPLADTEHPEKSIQDAITLRGKCIADKLREMGANDLVVVTSHQTVNIAYIDWHSPIYTKLTVARELFGKVRQEVIKRDKNWDISDSNDE